MAGGGPHSHHWLPLPGPTKPRSKHSHFDDETQISLTLSRSAPTERRPTEKFCLQPGSRTSSLPLAIFQAMPDYTVTVEALERVSEFCLLLPRNHFPDVCPLTVSPSVLLIKVPVCDTRAHPELHCNHHCSFLLLALHSPLSLLKKDSGTWHLPCSNRVAILTRIPCTHWGLPTGHPGFLLNGPPLQLEVEPSLCRTLLVVSLIVFP